MKNGAWLPNGSDSGANGICYDASTNVHRKCAHQRFVDSSEQELFFNKKQAVESVKETSAPEVMLCHDGPSFQSEDQTPSLFCPKPVRGFNGSNKDIHTSTNIEKKGFEYPSICLTMSRAVEDPLSLNSGHRKVKVNEVRISENCLPGNMFPGLTYDTADRNNVSMDPAFSKMDKNFVSVGQPSCKRDGNFMLTNQYYNGIDNNVLSIGQTFNGGNYNINPVGEQYEKEISNFTSVCPTYSRGHDSFFLLDPLYANKVNEAFISPDPNKGGTDINFGAQQDATVVSLGSLYNKENSSILTMVGNSKGEETTFSYGGFQNNVEEKDQSGKLVSSFDVLLNQSSVQSSGALAQKPSADQSANDNSATSSRADGANKNKDQKTKKGSSNNFPSNVKSLLSTGILDGVPVKYVSWSREKNLRGVVKGTRYLCSCQDCKLSKAINAYEFERHAGCKTKHPNNHIYFENGKTIYAVVQELKSTPQEMLFDVMQKVTGSPVNQKNFNTWKASYQAATRELQRIYGNEELTVLS